MRKSLMFQQENGERVPTWNPVVGCTHECSYCWARKLASTRLKHIYQNFKPRLIRSRLKKVPETNAEFVFVVSMGDLFCTGVKDEWILEVLKTIRSHEDKTFLLLTKNPLRYHDFLHVMPDNVILGATVESLDDFGYSKAPKPIERLRAMASITDFRKMLSVEPILQATREFAKEIRKVKPEFVYVGYDNWNNKLKEEPALKDALTFVEILETFTEVRVKTLRKAWWE